MITLHPRSNSYICKKGKYTSFSKTIKAKIFRLVISIEKISNVEDLMAVSKPGPKDWDDLIVLGPHVEDR